MTATVSQDYFRQCFGNISAMNDNEKNEFPRKENQIKKFVQKLTARRYPEHAPPYDDEVRAELGALEGWVSIVTNTLLAAGKAWLSLMSGSLSLAADAIHTFADSLTSVGIIIGFRMAKKPADDKHPFGHARIESITALIIGVLLAVASVELGRAAVGRLLEPEPVEAPIWMIITIIVMALIKELAARFSFELGALIDSDALAADAWHHRSDVFATLLVAVAFIASRFGVAWLDGAAGIGVALILASAACHIIARAAGPLIGEKLSDEEIEHISNVAGAVKGVYSVHDIVVQRYGTFQVISLHVEVSRELNVVEAHDISQSVENALQKELRAHATVHVDPKGEDHPDAARLRELIVREIEHMDGLLDIHDFRLEARENRRLVADFDIRTAEELSETVKSDFSQKLSDKVKSMFPHIQINPQFDPPFCRAAKRSNGDGTQSAAK